RFNCLSSASAGALHRALEQIGRIRRDAKAFSYMLARAVEPLDDGLRHHVGVERETANGRIEKIGLFFCQGATYVFDRAVVLIAAARLIERVFQHPLPAVTNLVF